MPLYYFDIQIGTSSPSVDEEGQVLRDIDAARVEATHTICEIARDFVRAGRAETIAVKVRDDLGGVASGKLEVTVDRLN